MRRSIFWEVFSGTLAAIATTLAIAVYIKEKKSKFQPMVEHFGDSTKNAEQEPETPPAS